MSKELTKQWCKGCSIFVCHSSKTSQLGNDRPCEMCQKNIDYVGIKDVYYTNENGEIVLEKPKT